MILQGDCLEKLKELDDNSVDSIVTDPPYELGFMHKKWDSSGISYNVDLWKECLRVLKPGGHLLSFGGSRTYHRMACAIEDAGFEIRDMIEWVYGSGFPKSLNIGKKIDQLQGNEREEVLRNPYADGHIRKATGNIKKAKDNVKFLSEYKLKDGLRKDTKGSSEWEGWGTALKPAHEPIVVARKPLSEKTIAKNVLKWGTGGINIDESRIGTTGGEIHKGGFQKKYVGDKVDYGKGKGVETDKTPQGRFPANLIHDGSDEVVEPFFKTNKQAKYKSASCFFYCAKASKKERNIGLKGFEKKNTSHDGRNKHIENPYQRHNNIQYNYHPTVKPIKLMKYLVRLVTPKDGIVLDPFMGSGTTGMACKKEGFRFIGIELDKKYCKIAEARIKSY